MQQQGPRSGGPADYSAAAMALKRAAGVGGQQVSSMARYCHSVVTCLLPYLVLCMSLCVFTIAGHVHSSVLLRRATL
jgi:hypothetical protein